MSIIPHNKGFVQVSFSSIARSEGRNTAFQPSKVGFFSRSLVESYALYDQGFNVFPLPFGHKNGYPWKTLQYTRVPRQHPELGLGKLTLGDCNLAVMCGSTSGNLFVIDCETPQILGAHMKKLMQRRIPLWVVRTARGGHIYLRSATGEVSSIPSGTLPYAEVRGRGGYVLAPPSLHPSGVRYRWLLRQGNHVPVVDPAQIDWLTDASGQPVRLAVQPRARRSRPLHAISPLSALSATTRDYLQRGALLPEGTRNNRLFAAACDMLGNAYTPEETRQMLFPVALASGLSPYETDKTLESASARQRTPSRPQASPSPAGHQLWKLALFYATLHPWRGAAAATERAVFLALVERARLSVNQRGVFRASIRELAALARAGINTVQRVLTRFQLADTPLLFHVGQDALSGANTWRFSDYLLNQARRHLARNPQAVVPAHWQHYTDALFNSDAAERGAVGKSAMFLYQWMRCHDEPLMPARLAAASGLSRNQVNYSLARLRALGLVLRLSTGWVAHSLPLRALTEHALRACPKVAGRGARRRRLFMEERQRYAARILLKARLQRDGRPYQEALKHTLPVVLCRDQLDEDIRWVLDCKVAKVLFEAGGECTLENGVVLSYCALD